MKGLSNSERVLQYLKEHTSIGVTYSVGSTTEQLAIACQIERTQTSKLLNQLVSQKKICKIKGKPVYYYYLLERYQVSQWVFESERALIDHLSESLLVEKEQPVQAFDAMIGVLDSLKTQVKLAKAAVLYPPAGLNTLILGPTGIGKTLFAEVMYRYSLEIRRLPANSPFVVLNCADYAGNPQLLLSLLFGYRKGAFTGAVTDKQGLIQEANGGILFLDEIHRLPAEGQEMLFSLIDRNKYRRLGETSETSEAQVMLIGATTETIGQSLLGTFLRRIPNKITLPPLATWGPQERLELLDLFFKKESKKVQLPIEVSPYVIGFFLSYTCKGNIGQLKNEVKMLCATTYAEAVLTKHSRITLDQRRLIEEYGEKYQVKEIVESQESVIVPSNVRTYYKGLLFADNVPQKGSLSYYYHQKEEAFYQKLLAKYATLVESGQRGLELKSEMRTDLEAFFKLSLATEDRENQAIGKVVSNRVLDVLHTFFERTIFEDLKVDQKMLNSLALHIETLLIKLQSGKKINTQMSVTDMNVQDYQLAEKLKTQLEEEFELTIPYQEVVVMALFLSAVSVRQKNERIGVLVIMHGDSVASGMAKVANDLLEVNDTQSIDMRLTDSVAETYERALQKVLEIDCGKGVLLLVDMGSLNSFAERISSETGIDVQYLTMVNTPMVIEATRKSQYTNLTLTQLIQEIVMESQYIGHQQENYFEGNESPFDIFDSTLFSQYERMRLIMLVKQSGIFVNTSKACQQLDKLIKAIAQIIPLAIEKNLIIKFVVHGISMIERAIIDEQIELRQFECKNLALFNVIKEQIWLIEEAFNCHVSDSELFYLEEFIEPYIATQ